MQEANEKEMTFWDHLDELRKVCFRIAIAVILLACIAFLNKETISSLIPTLNTGLSFENTHSSSSYQLPDRKSRSNNDSNLFDN